MFLHLVQVYPAQAKARNWTRTNYGAQLHSSMFTMLGLRLQLLIVTDIPNTSLWLRKGCAVWWKWAQTIQWTYVPLVPRGTLQVRIRFVRQWNAPTLEQRNTTIDAKLLLIFNYTWGGRSEYLLGFFWWNRLCFKFDQNLEGSADIESIASSEQ